LASTPVDFVQWPEPVRLGPEHCITVAPQQFNLVTQWHVGAPVERVWVELSTPEDWPRWWRAVKHVVVLHQGDAAGVGSERRMTWRTALPYEIAFDMRTTRIEPMSLIEGKARGELDGLGRWTLRPEGAGTHVRYDWQVELSRPWMRACAPLLRPVFAWNHNVVMGWGYEGLCRRLGVAP
jgi:uncharacterized protein YndB with AHSA1/START domain